MTGMIERVARALADSMMSEMGMGADSEIADAEGNMSPLWQGFTKEARAAIEAMREPTEAMIMTQGRSKPENARTETQRRLAEELNRSVRQMANVQWREMIQAALEDSQ